jgi:hypothetical protein
MTTEAGGVDTFTVVLETQPRADVTIAVASDDTTEGTVSVTELVFTSDNWDSPQAVTVAGQDDDQVDGDIDYRIVLGSAVSQDPAYNGFDVADVLISNTDDDAPVPTGDFDIEIRFPDNSLSAAARAVFLEAAARWEEIILGDLPDVNTDIGLVDDIVIDAIAAPIDGSGGTLAFAGPRQLRSGSSLPSRVATTHE